MALPFIDNFDRANDAEDLGANWDDNTSSGGGSFEILSNCAHVVVATNGNDGAETVNSETLNANQYIQITLGSTATDGLGTGYGVVGRADATAKTYYRLVAGGDGWELARFNAGSSSTLASVSSTTFTTGDGVRLELLTNAANCDWTVKKNGSTVTSGTGSDTSPITSAGRGGIGYSSYMPTAVTGIQSFEMGNLGGSPVGAAAYYYSQQ
jgi:hypothetical protein